ncbi:MAG TPA: methyltransferase domain-containing protein [Gemmatimonadales bacterium]|nr:methyltransferase domain-containing protein [Gemmatimonadales bacterium]
MIGRELLDDPRADPRAVLAELRDIARLNTLFGGTRAVVEALEPFFRQSCNGQRASCNVRWTLLDVGTGLGDIPQAAAAAARRYGVKLRPIGVELNPTAAHLARGNGMPAVLGDGNALPIRPRSVDVIVASQVLHHLPRTVAVRWIASFDRLARRAVVLADLRRSRLAMVGVWAASLGLGMSRVTRHDAVVSLRRGYTKREFQEMLTEAGVSAVARYRPGSRVVASWAPEASSVIRCPSSLATDDGRRLPCAP